MRQLTMLLAILCTATTAATAAAQPLTQKLGKEAAKGAASAAKEEAPDLGKTSREVVGGAVDSLVSRRAKVEMLSNDVGREIVRGALVAAATALDRACAQDPHCIRNEAHDVGFALGEGMAQGVSTKLSVVSSVLSFALGFVFASLLAGFIYLVATHRRQQPVAPPLVPRATH